ncbi:MAG: L-seryl-tRNA(Sec) selenium transferase [Deltaproteobacteria bacterium]|nr:L-seryl-tRNA(Sec) selenium transferase [Deltaproteobacteria bacterium]
MAHPPESRNVDLLRVLPTLAQVEEHLAGLGHPLPKAGRPRARQEIQRLREALQAGAPGAPADKPAALAALTLALARPAPEELRRVINATGVVIHTNLGRAPLSPALTAAALPLLHGYTNLEFNLADGKRGGRGGQIPQLLAQLSGAEQGLAVNNNAAAVLLLLAALAAGGEVIVSRGELVEIGGAFRVPDILRQARVKLIEVGTTNRTRLSDYARAITPKTKGILKVHRSNFFMDGFVEDTPVPDLARLAREKNIGLWNDLGSGNFYRFSQPALAGIPTVQQALAEGAQVVTFSGDKLLGSVQAGVAVGNKSSLGVMARHPLYRVVRMDKARMALLEQSLAAYLDIPRLHEVNPVIALLERTLEELRPLGQRLLALLPPSGGLAWELVEEVSLAGGGAVPEARIPTLCLAVTPRKNESAETLAAALRGANPPVIGRVSEGRMLLDLRTLLDGDLEDLAQVLTSLA